MAIINIGILAHVDAGKTTLSERILYETGVIGDVGSVDKGTTQTDTLELERARGITINSAVVSFNLGDLKVNLVDTPGHPDFIAEVERSLSVLDAVVLVISAVEGVQSQTRRLTRAIRASGLPMLIFVNKIDRAGARSDRLLGEIQRSLAVRIVPMVDPVNAGERAASVLLRDWRDRARRDGVIDLLAEGNDAVIAEFDRTGGRVEDDFLAAETRSQIASGRIVPVYFGSAITGVGVPELLRGVRDWLPEAPQGADQPITGTVFKISRMRSGEKVVYARIESGAIGVRDQVRLHRLTHFEEPASIEDRVTAIDRFEAGTTIPVAEALAGEIVRLHGLRGALIGDRLGNLEHRTRSNTKSFPPPALESAVHPSRHEDIMRLRFALEQLAEQDPLISLRQRNDAGELSVRLYGEVQKEVILDTLAGEYSVDAWFGPSQTICIERVLGAGEHVELIGGDGNPFPATVGLRVEPGPIGSGVRYERDLGALPPAFYRALEETVYESLAQGLSGWEVTDCLVTLTQRGMTPATVARDYRLLTPLVLMHALQAAGTEVCEPIDDLDMEIPEDAFGPVCGALLNANATIGETVPSGTSLQIRCQIPAANLRSIEQQLPALTRGEGGWESRFAGYRPVPGDPPKRARIGPNPLNRAHYLAEIARS